MLSKRFIQKLKKRITRIYIIQAVNGFGFGLLGASGQGIVLIYWKQRFDVLPLITTMLSFAIPLILVSSIFWLKERNID